MSGPAGLSTYLATSACTILVAVTIAQGTFYYRNYDGGSKFIKYFAQKSNFEIVSQCTNIFVKASIPFEYVSGHKTWLAGIIIVLSILQLGTGIGQYNLDAIPASLSGLLLKLHFTLAATAYITITGSISSVYARGALITQTVASTSTILCDALISGSLVYLLREKPLNRSMRIGIGKITIYSINIGLITVAVSTIILITWLAAPHPQFTWEIFFFPAAQVYVNSVLVS
ncbi:hypothetical protein M422DRAFT_253741 [Sphaerobolus stellatus SS14]|uniref:DUF6534 domain-containing protein n=1 Tax=Sphaerobolus stellatus (strain SS14) TaxID=990650 RepID=A0A0C9VW69_SPHS4|nr:hypothetical protein M422DRAFT_253741 [Sphaerobolus stellatus SS14]